MPGVVVDHNTVLHTGNVLTAYGEASAGLVFTNNIIRHNLYGIIGVGQGPGNGTLKAYFPGAVFRRNLIVGADFSLYPADNFYPTRMAKAGLVDPERNDYRLRPDSAYKGKATDNKDVGCDYALLQAATARAAGR
jgi:hypothetical protein